MTGEQLIELLIGGIAIGCIYSLIALGFTMIIRSTGVLNFAQGDIVMIGAMFGLIVYALAPLPFPILLIAGSVAGGVCAVLIELGVYRTLRVRGVPLNNIIIATIGVSILLQSGAQLSFGSEPMGYPKLFSAAAYGIGPVRLSPQMIWIIVLGIIMMVLLQLFISYTRIGRSMQAAAQDPIAAQLMGINLTATSAYTYGIAGMLGGGAGVLLGSLFYTSFNMGFLPGIKAFVAATIGGLGSIGGAMIGGVIFGLIETFGSVSISTAYKDAIGMLLLIVVLLIWPSGLAGVNTKGGR